MTRSILTFEDGVRAIVEVGDQTNAEHELALTQLLAPPAAAVLGPWNEPGGPAAIHAAYELLRRQGNATSRIVDAAFVGHNSPGYAGNINIANRTRSRSILGQHLVDPQDGDDHPIPEALQLLQSIQGTGRSVELNRSAFVVERSLYGDVTADTMLLELRKRAGEGASDTGPWIGDARGETWMVQSDGTVFSRGGFFAMGDDANVVLRGGSAFVEYGGVVVALGPGVSSEDSAGTSIALANLGSLSIIGDIYGGDQDLLLTGSGSTFTAYGLFADLLALDGTSTRPAEFDATNWGLWVDSDTDELKFWDGSSDTVLGGGSGSVSAPLDLGVDDATTNAATTILTLRHTTSGTAAAGLGARIKFELEDSAGNTDEAGSIDFVWQDATTTAEDSDIVFRTRFSGSMLEAHKIYNSGAMRLPETTSPGTPPSAFYNLYASTRGLVGVVDAGTKHNLIITDWASFTPTGNWVANTTYAGMWRRVGDTMEVQLTIVLSGAPTTATLDLDVPNSETVDEAKLPSGVTSVSVGEGHANDVGADQVPVEVVYDKSQNVFFFLAQPTATDNGLLTITQASPWTWASGDYITVRFAFPVTDWGTA